MPNLIQKILGDPHAREIKRLQSVVDKINAAEPDIQNLSDAQLKAKTDEFKKRLEGKESLDDLLVEAFAVVREASKRAIGMRHYDVQMIGGQVLHRGQIAEMRTGEGKTLVATAPVYLNALAGKGVHVVTVNDYLARRDAGWMSQVYHFLGMSVGIIVPEASFGVPAFIYDPEFTDPEASDPRLAHLRPASRQEAYAADITYGTNNEFGFDYLRDNMVDSLERMVQRPLNYAIVDEVDSILIDEARTPLIISAPAQEATDKYYQFAAMAKRLKADEDYTLDEKLKAASLTDEGVAKVEQMLGVDNVYESGRIDDVHHIEAALKAQALYLRDRDYVVREGEIIIVDEFTGRLMPGRRWSEGLHQAVEAKEGVQIRQESITLATITFQNYFRLYSKLAGMTGTAATEAEEFAKIYSLDVTTIPTHQPMVRRDLPDRIYKTEVGKFRAVAREVAERHAQGQPVLIGTVSIAKNELLSDFLSQLKVPHEVLNAKNNEAEAAIIAGAGHKGAVTLATNIAGRGTDIVLGDGVADLGGLHVLGTERHESRRIDNQLRGRAGRQGDNGSSQFYVSLEDDLMRIFGSDRIAGMMDALGIDEDTPIENALVSRSLESAQKRVEGHNFDARKHVVDYDDVMNKHRESIYSRRRRALESEALKPEILGMIRAQVQLMVTAHTDPKTQEIDWPALKAALEQIMPLAPELEQGLQQAYHTEERVERMMDEVEHLYAHREQEFGDLMQTLERLVYINVLDQLWIDHLEVMENLRSGIGLRAIGQRDPLVEYKREAYRVFQQLLQALEAEVAFTIFKRAITRVEPEAPVDTALTRAAAQASTNSPEAGVASVDGVQHGGSRAERRAKPAAGGPSATKRTNKKKRRK